MGWRKEEERVFSLYEKTHVIAGPLKGRSFSSLSLQELYAYRYTAMHPKSDKLEMYKLGLEQLPYIDGEIAEKEAERAAAATAPIDRTVLAKAVKKFANDIIAGIKDPVILNRIDCGMNSLSEEFGLDFDLD